MLPRDGVESNFTEGSHVMKCAVFVDSLHSAVCTVALLPFGAGILGRV